MQGVIDRLAGNSFALKGWSVTLVSALLALAVSETKSDLILVALLPALTFWGLDGYFLAQERHLERLPRCCAPCCPRRVFPADRQRFLIRRPRLSPASL